MLLLGVDGLCTGGVTQTATQTVWGAGGGIGVERFGKQPLPKINSTKRGGKHSLTFQPNLRVQEAPGSNPGTPTMRSVLIGFEYPWRTLRIIFAQNPIRQSAPGSS